MIRHYARPARAGAARRGERWRGKGERDIFVNRCLGRGVSRGVGGREGWLEKKKEGGLGEAGTMWATFSEVISMRVFFPFFSFFLPPPSSPFLPYSEIWMISRKKWLALLLNFRWGGGGKGKGKQQGGVGWSFCFCFFFFLFLYFCYDNWDTGPRKIWGGEKKVHLLFQPSRTCTYYSYVLCRTPVWKFFVDQKKCSTYLTIKRKKTVDHFFFSFYFPRHCEVVS